MRVLVAFPFPFLFFLDKFADRRLKKAAEWIFSKNIYYL